MTFEKFFFDYLFKGLIWLIWDFLGLRFVCSKIVPAKPNTQKRPPATIFI